MPDGYARLRPSPIVNAANAVTFARLCAVPVAVWLLLHQAMGAAFAVCAAAGLSDALDGWLARRHGPTPLGAMLDPAADKALVASMFVTLAATGRLPDWITILVVFREVLIVGGIALLRVTGAPLRLRALAISKVNTALQLLLIAVTLGLPAFGVEAPGLVLALVWAVAAVTTASGAAYIVRVATGDAAR